MIKRLLALDGVMAVCKFTDDGSFVEGYGMLPDSEMQRLAKFALEYKRMVQGNADQLAMFTQMNGWTPPGGWMVRGPQMSACSMSNVVCIFNNAEASVNEVMQELRDVANY
jgi:roadblock/LC7 domain-containing protein